MTSALERVRLRGHPLRTAQSTTDRNRRQIFPTLPMRLSATIRSWIERSRQRQALRKLAERNDYLLKDIGVSQAEALREAAKPFWEP
jgi:uncharacterized protein YjiS (DUF1127 family)